MNDFNYCQLDINNICICVSQLNGVVPEYNYNTEKNFNPLTGQFENGQEVFISRMIRVEVYSPTYIGLKYNDITQSWEEVPK